MGGRVLSVTEIMLVGGERLRVEGEARSVEAAILSAARGSLMELAWMTEAHSGQPVGVNPDHVLLIRGAVDPGPLNDESGTGDAPAPDAAD
jgi:hypothetical protein